MNIFSCIYTGIRFPVFHCLIAIVHSLIYLAGFPVTCLLQQRMAHDSFDALFQIFLVGFCFNDAVFAFSCVCVCVCVCVLNFLNQVLSCSCIAWDSCGSLIRYCVCDDSHSLWIIVIVNRNLAFSVRLWVQDVSFSEGLCISFYQAWRRWRTTFVCLFNLFILSTPHSLWDFSSPARDWTQALWNESTES